MRFGNAAATPAPLRACLGVALVLCAFAGCDEACPAGYEAELDQCVVRANVKPPHPCEVLPESKTDSAGTGRLIRVNEPSDGCFWMDETEVLVADYQAWAQDAKTRKVTWDEKWCLWKETASDPIGDTGDACARTIPSRDLRPFAPTKPIRCVDFCDAQAFCTDQGKRLCFGAGTSGGVLEPRTTREWTLACTNTLTTVYPFGDDASGTDCNVAAGASCVVECRVLEPGRQEGCKTPSGIADLVGNVAEWTEACNFIPEGTDDSFVTSCLARGGSFATPIQSCYDDVAVRADLRRNDIGFRCCDDLAPDELRAVAAGVTPQ